MNYRHSYHAGNFADVVKHIALVAIVAHLKKKDTAFSAVDSHAGRGSYDLTGDQALRTGEAKAGIARLIDMTGDLPDALSTYLSLVREAGMNAYPGSPLIAARLLRPQDRLTAIEKHPEEFAALKEVLAPFRNATAEQADGYGRVLKLLPPSSRRGLLVMDPPFESPDEFSALARALREAHRKFATGIILAWHAIKSRSEADGFVGEVLAGGIAKAITVEIKVGAQEGKLDRAGLLVINPPYGFEAQMAAAGRLIAPRLDGEITQAWVAGGE